jgi:hypothetical protein
MLAAIKRGWMAVSGWVLYWASWVTPSLDGRRTGAWAFLSVPRFGFDLLSHPGSLLGCLIGLCLVGGWLANFSIFLRLSVWARVAWIVAPWLPFGVALLTASGASLERAASFPYFYPWAIGIALIHGAKIRDARHYLP